MLAKAAQLTKQPATTAAQLTGQQQPPLGQPQLNPAQQQPIQQQPHPPPEPPPVAGPETTAAENPMPEHTMPEASPAPTEDEVAQENGLEDHGEVVEQGQEEMRAPEEATPELEETTGKPAGQKTLAGRGSRGRGGRRGGRGRGRGRGRTRSRSATPATGDTPEATGAEGKLPLPLPGACVDL